MRLSFCPVLRFALLIRYRYVKYKIMSIKAAGIYFLVLLSAFASCKKDHPDSVEQIPIESLKGTAPNIDLSKRTGWILAGGDKSYSFTVTGDSILAMPASEPYILRYDNNDPKIPFNYIGFGLIPALYYTTNTAVARSLYATSPVTRFPNIADQSTEEKLRNADALIAINYEKPSKNIKDARFIHSNVLIDFETMNFPGDAVVTVLQSEETKPFNYKSNFYKAIVVAVPVISVKTGGDEYKVMLTVPGGMSGNTHYTFKTVFNADAKTLSITDLASSKWSDGDE